MTCSAAGEGTHAHTPNAQWPPHLQNSCHCCLNREICYITQAGPDNRTVGYFKTGSVKMCHITFTLKSFSRTTLSIQMPLAYLSHLHLTQLASQMPKLPIQGFSLRKNQRSSKWIQSNFPTSWLSKHWNTCMDCCHVLKKWLWMHAKVF